MRQGTDVNPLYLLLLLVRRVLAGPRPAHVYRTWEHTTWGDSIQWVGNNTFTGWLYRIPQKGDTIVARGRNGELLYYRAYKVRRCGDPPDMFFADVRLFRIAGTACSGEPTP